MVEQNNYCCQRQRQTESISGYDVEDSHAAQKSETQDLITLPLDDKAPRAERNGTEYVLEFLLISN